MSSINANLAASVSQSIVQQREVSRKRDAEKSEQARRSEKFSELYEQTRETVAQSDQTDTGDMTLDEHHHANALVRQPGAHGHGKTESAAEPLLDEVPVDDSHHIDVLDTQVRTDQSPPGHLDISG